jgi:hypothetical protein
VAAERIEDHLLVECAKWNGATDLLIATSGGFEPRAHFEAQLDALAAVGLLTPDEMQAWRGRFEEAGRAARPVEVDEALRRRVDRYLESLLPADEDDDQLGEAIAVLERLGVLTEDEGMRWHRRALEADPDYDEDDEDDDWPEYDARELRRVLLGPLEETAGLRVTSVELYAGAVVVRWNAAPGARLVDDMEPDLALSDDAGTDYAPIGGGAGSGGGARMRGETTFVPGVPQTATRLTLAWPGANVAFEL